MKIYYINYLSERIDLTDGEFHTTEVNGVSLYTDIQSKENAFKHGADYISEHINKRKISIMVYPEGDYDEAREKLSVVFRTGGEGTLYFDYGGGTIRSIRCRSEKINADLKARSDEIQITFMALDPFFVSEQKVVVLRGVMGFLEFDDTWEIFKKDNILSEYGENTSVRSKGTQESDCIIKVIFSLPCNSIKIISTKTGEYFKLKGSYKGGDILLIDSGKKDVTLIRDGVSSDITSRIEWGSSFLNIKPSETRLTVETEDPYIEVIVIFKERFENV